MKSIQLRALQFTQIKEFTRETWSTKTVISSDTINASASVFAGSVPALVPVGLALITRVSVLTEARVSRTIFLKHKTKSKVIFNKKIQFNVKKGHFFTCSCDQCKGHESKDPTGTQKHHYGVLLLHQQMRADDDSGALLALSIPGR